MLPVGYFPALYFPAGYFPASAPTTFRATVPTAARRVVRPGTRSPVPDRAEVRAGPDA